MTQPNRENYEFAQDLIAAGRWTVDPALGTVSGVNGQPFVRRNTDGYVQIKFRDPNAWRIEHAVLAHRVIWERVHGPLAFGLEINHISGVKTNNRITNLEAVDHQANMHHAMVTGLTHVVRGTDHHSAVLTDDEVRAIYTRAWTGEDQASIGQDYGVGRGIVSNIKCGHAWTHVTQHQRSMLAA